MHRPLRSESSTCSIEKSCVAGSVPNRELTMATLSTPPKVLISVTQSIFTLFMAIASTPLPPKNNRAAIGHQNTVLLRSDERQIAGAGHGHVDHRQGIRAIAQFDQ